MSTRKGRLERERELAAYYQAHKEEGEWEPVGVERPARAGAVYSIRFTAEELDSLRAIADREGKRISQVVRDALARYLASEREPGHSLITDLRRSRVIFFTPVVSRPTATTGHQPRQVTYEGPRTNTISV